MDDFELTFEGFAMLLNGRWCEMKEIWNLKKSRKTVQNTHTHTHTHTLAPSSVRGCRGQEGGRSLVPHDPF